MNGPERKPELDLQGEVQNSNELTNSNNPIEKRKLARTGTIFRNAIDKINPVRYAHDVYNRGNLEGLATAGAIDGITAPFIPIIQPLIATAIYTGESITDPSLAAAVAATTISGLTLISIRKDAEALRKEHFDASTIGTILFPFMGSPLASAIADHGINYFFVGTISPAAAIALASGDIKFYSASLLASSLMMPIWYTFVNSAIAKGELDRVINPIKEKRLAFQNKIKQAIFKK